VPRELVDDLLELARWAPNHHLTNPWRFRVLGPSSLIRLGWPRQEKEPPPRLAPAELVRYPD
jgi:hypothetical protein